MLIIDPPAIAGGTDCIQEAVATNIAKKHERAYTPALTCPPSQKVSQVEIEAGDSEGRLPQPFLLL